MPGMTGRPGIVPDHPVPSQTIRPHKLDRPEYWKPPIHYRNRVLCRVSKTLGKGYFTLGKAFAECNNRQRTLDKYFIGKGFFAECFFRTLGKDFVECQKALGKEKHSAN
jgi:hypothetical protein